VIDRHDLPFSHTTVFSSPLQTTRPALGRIDLTSQKHGFAAATDGTEILLASQTLHLADRYRTLFLTCHQTRRKKPEFWGNKIPIRRIAQTDPRITSPTFSQLQRSVSSSSTKLQNLTSATIRLTIRGSAFGFFDCDSCPMWIPTQPNGIKETIGIKIRDKVCSIAALIRMPSISTAHLRTI
jgi:hypothetical protein